MFYGVDNARNANNRKRKNIIFESDETINNNYVNSLKK